jgi:hypothetical protein
MSEEDAGDRRVITEPYNPIYNPFSLRPVLVKQ